MAKKTTRSSCMTHGETVSGFLLFAVYLLVMPLLMQRLLRLIGTLLDVSISTAAGNAAYYYVLFAAVLLLFHRFLGDSFSRFFASLDRCCVTAGAALVFFYGANELFYRLCGRFYGGVTNLNNTAIAASVDAAPRTTAVIVLLLAPFVEEVLFRGLVFGVLAEKSRAAAYAVSSLLFAFSHVWVFLLGGMSVSYLVVMAGYLIPGLVFAWAYDRSGSVVTAFFVHAAVNALALWALA